MALRDNPTNNQLVKEVKRLDAEKQGTLTAGDNIDITSSVISAKDVVTTNTAQTIEGKKTISGRHLEFIQGGGSGGSNKLEIYNDNGYNAKIRMGGAENIRLMSTSTSFGTTVSPINNNQYDLGASGNKWRDAYIERNLTDGTNSITIADIANKNEILLKPLSLSTTTMTDEQIATLRAYNCVLTNDLTLGNTSLKAGTILTVPFEYNNSLRGMAIYNNKILTYYINLTTKVIGDGAQDIVISNVANLQTGKVDFGNNATITRDSSDRINLNYSNDAKVKVGSAETIIKNRIGADSDNSQDIGRSTVRWKDGYFAGVLSDGTNSISIANIVAKQDALVSGTNIKTINNESILGSGNITISGGGTATDVKVDGTSITSNNEADLQTINGDYDASTNKLATEADLPTVPTNVSSFTNDAGYLTSYTETDPTVPSWAKQSTKPTYAYSEITGTPTIPTATSDLTNDSGFITSSDISGKEDSSNKVTSISSSSTDTQYASAKCTYDAIEDVREVAAGKTSTFVCSDVTNTVLNSQNASISVSSALTDINSQTIALADFSIGDNIYITETDVPDRWVSAITKSGSTVTGVTLTKLETAKVPVTDVQVNGSTIISNNVANLAVQGTYNSSTNKIATMSEVPSTTSSVTSGSNAALTSGGAYTNLVSDITYDSTNKKLKKTKAGSNSDLVTFGANAFTDTTIPNIPTTSTAGKVLKSTSTAGTVEWGDAPAGSSTDVQVNGTSITSNGIANILTNTAYDASTNKIATMSDLPDISTKMDKANPTGTGSLSLNRKANTTIGTNSVAEGYDTTASGTYSHAEGFQTTASGSNGSHAEGFQTTASGASAHTEGRWTISSGDTSHAEGVNTTASGSYSHTEGVSTTAQRRSQHAFGEYNVLDTNGSTTSDKGSYIEIVGNGTESNGTITRSNARTLDWSGNEWLAGKITPAGGISDGKNANYELQIPDTTNWTADKTIATTDQIPSTYVSSVNGSSGAITNIAVTNANNNFSTAQTVTGNVTATKFIGGLDYLTTAPTAANTNGLKIVVLSSEPATRYSGYIYFITE